MYFIDYDSPSLAHHGVKGMKWGVRHDRERTGSMVKSFGRELGTGMARRTVALGAAIGGRAVVNHIGNTAVTGMIAAGAFDMAATAVTLMPVISSGAAVAAAYGALKLYTKRKPSK